MHTRRAERHRPYQMVLGRLDDEQETGKSGQATPVGAVK
jgi:hypothetical protein